MCHPLLECELYPLRLVIINCAVLLVSRKAKNLINSLRNSARVAVWLFEWLQLTASPISDLKNHFKLASFRMMVMTGKASASIKQREEWKDALNTIAFF